MYWWNVPISDRTASNQYLSGMLARRFGGGLSIGAGLVAGRPAGASTG